MQTAGDAEHGKKLDVIKRDLKETVIIVHGTWSNPQAGLTRWHEVSAPGSTETLFAEVLNRGLEERNCAARVWAHCGVGTPPFAWSGGNSWIDRADAAQALSAYLNNLPDWHCHIIAHSHGGNIVADALPMIRTSIGAVITMGTPYIDVMSSITADKKRGKKISACISGAFAMIGVALAWRAYSFYGVGDTLRLLLFTSITSVFWFASDLFGIFVKDRWERYWPGTVRLSRQPVQVYALNSKLDEAWQFLHNLGLARDPFVPRVGLIRFVLARWQLDVRTRRRIRVAQGKPSLGDPLDGAGYGLRAVFGAPFRVLSQALRATIGIPQSIGIYIARKRIWRVIKSFVLGMDGFPYDYGTVAMQPLHDGQKRVVLEMLPDQVTERVRAARAVALGGHVDKLLEVLSEVALTEDEIINVLRSIETEVGLVHAAYYSDPWCINRIAELIRADDRSWHVRQFGWAKMG